MIESLWQRHRSVQQAIAALEAGACIWCEQAPAATTSYLCGGCRSQDVEGLLRKPLTLRALGDAAA
jgi:hypothetical protein